MTTSTSTRSRAATVRRSDNLLLIRRFYDVALRDFGLFVAALALARLASVFPATDARRAARGPAA